MLATLVASGAFSVRLARAHMLYLSGSQRGLDTAIGLVPGNSTYWRELGARTNSESAIERALRLNPRDSQAWIELGLKAESEGNFAKAERSLRHATIIDKTHKPAWTLANYYFRRDDRNEFWLWAERSGATAGPDILPLMSLAWNKKPEPDQFLKMIPKNPEPLQQAFIFLSWRAPPREVQPVLDEFLKVVNSGHVPLLLDYCDRLLGRARECPECLDQAVALWNRLADRQLMSQGRVDPANSPVNSHLSKPLLGRGFDWRTEAKGISIRHGPLPKVQFSGSQPEDCEVLWQYIPVEPHRRFEIVFRYRATDTPAMDALAWRVYEAPNGPDLAEMAAHDLADGDWRTQRMRFQSGSGTRLVKLALVHRRRVGSTRARGDLSWGALSLKEVG
jgi:tetratricopeptide (TPR) repeat protein